MKSRRDISKSAVIMEKAAFAWRNTIFCESENNDLKAALDRCAKELGCRIWYNDDTAPDILAVGSFIHIVDRRLIGEKTWRYYVQCCDGSRDDIPCILVDDISDLPLPKTKFLLQLDLGQDSISRITNTIHEMKDRLNQNHPAAFRMHSLPSVQKKVTREDGSVNTKFYWE
jgi:hypothetical protein